MQAFRLKIDQHNRVNPVDFASPSDFLFSRGEPIDPQFFLVNPNLSLYCLDPLQRQALFVETPVGIDLSQAPFYYQAQYENAVGLYSLDYQGFHTLAESIQAKGEDLILVYSVGRTGSTLLSAVFSACKELTSLSEPDVFSQLVVLRAWDGSNDSEIASLAESCIKWTCKPVQGEQNRRKWALKFRSFCIEIADLIYAKFPSARSLFLYREALGWIESNGRAFTDAQFDTPDGRIAARFWLDSISPFIAQYPTSSGESLSLAKMVTLLWLSLMARYQALYEQGLPFLAVRYNDMTGRFEQVIEEILAYCALDPGCARELLGVLEKDSQAGSPLSRENLQRRELFLTEHRVAEVWQILGDMPCINRPDYTLPGTLFAELP